MTPKQLDQLHRGIAKQNQARDAFESDLAGLGLIGGALFFLIVVAVIGVWGVF